VIPRYLALRERIHTELEALDQTQQAVARHWSRTLTVMADQDAYINSVALNLHSFYSGLEHLFELIAIELDGGTLGGADWHIELLRQMTLDLPQVRPPVLSKESAAKLDEYRKFRHRVRNIYATNLDPQRMRPLVEELGLLWADIREELNRFADFLAALAQTDNGTVNGG
jgi:hypothetical protein